MIPAHQITMLTLPTQARPLCQGFFHQWGRIDEDLDLPLCGLCQPPRQALGGFFNNIMIIAPPGIGRNIGAG